MWGSAQSSVRDAAVSAIRICAANCHRLQDRYGLFRPGLTDLTPRVRIPSSEQKANIAWLFFFHNSSRPALWSALPA